MGKKVSEEDLLLLLFGKPDENKYGVHSEFDIEKHKETFVNYLEVVIDEHGKVMYAVPSHQEKLLSIASQRTGKSKQQIYDDSVKSGWTLDWLEYLCEESSAIPVWNDFFVGNPNKNQQLMLRKLKEHGLYKGKLGFIGKDAITK